MYTRLLRVVAQRLAHLLHAGDQRVVADHRAAPHVREQILLGHRRAGLLEQRAEHLRGLARQLDLGAVSQSRAGRLEAESVRR
jgi:3-methyladenine DNA glycosylase/8-oxoguanine DNA glycosylase